MLVKQKHPSLPRNLALRTFSELPIVFSMKVITHLFNSLEVLSSPSDEAKLFPGNFSKNPNHDNSGICISLPVLSSRNNLNLHNIYEIPKMVKKVITNLDLSKTSGPDCIPAVVLNKQLF